MITWKEIAYGAIAVLVAITGYVFLGLQNQVNEQSTLLAKLSRQMNIVVSILSMKMPDANLPALISTAAERNIGPEKVATVMPLINSNPSQAKVYMKTQMQLNNREIDLIMQPAEITNKNDMMQRLK